MNNLRSVVWVSTGVGSGCHILTVGGVNVCDVAVLRHHPVELLHAAPRLCLLQVQEEGGPVSISPSQVDILKNILNLLR